MRDEQIYQLREIYQLDFIRERCINLIKNIDSYDLLTETLKQCIIEVNHFKFQTIKDQLNEG